MAEDISQEEISVLNDPAEPKQALKLVTSRMFQVLIVEAAPSDVQDLNPWNIVVVPVILTGSGAVIVRFAHP
jgi:hypothetical protein